MKLKYLILLPLLFLISYTLYAFLPMPDIKTDAKPVSHEIWNELLKKHVSDIGKVNYKGFQKDISTLDKYLKTLSDNHPNPDSWTKEERLAYWINAYNAFTVKIVLKHYPVKSIKDITSFNIPMVHSVWDLKFIEIEGHKYDLNNIEHQILRKKFDEPRIHFAINCASVSCPNLLNEAYLPESLEKQLQKQAVAFVNDNSKNKLGQEEIEISKIFSWFKGDFTKKGTLVDFINQYAEEKISKNVSVDFLSYDWNLNE